MAKILVVEDTPEILDNIVNILTAEHYLVETAQNGLDAWELLNAYTFDLILLDWQLPSISGLEICRRFRQKGKLTPVLMLTGRGEENDKVDGLNAGADDYVTKPFSPRELIARVNALLRRSSGVAQENMTVGGIVLDTVSRRVFIDGAEIKFKPLEYNLLEFMMRNRNKVLSPEHILQHVWDTNTEASVDSVYVCVNRVRKKLGTEGEHIRTVHAVGYQFI